MKLFLTTSVVGMVAAGIFGIYDFSNDVKHGNYIVYEQDDDSDGEASESTGRKSKAMNMNNAVSIVQEEFSSTTKKVVKEEYFSRGEPISIEEVIPPVEPQEEVAKTEQTKEPVKLEVVEKRGEKPNKRKFSYNLYSRGRPPKIVEEEAEEVVVAVTDSTKKE